MRAQVETAAGSSRHLRLSLGADGDRGGDESGTDTDGTCSDDCSSSPSEASTNRRSGSFASDGATASPPSASPQSESLVTAAAAVTSSSKHAPAVYADGARLLRLAPSPNARRVPSAISLPFAGTATGRIDEEDEDDDEIDDCQSESEVDAAAGCSSSSSSYNESQFNSENSLPRSEEHLISTRQSHSVGSAMPPVSALLAAPSWLHARALLLGHCIDNETTEAAVTTESSMANDALLHRHRRASLSRSVVELFGSHDPPARVGLDALARSVPFERARPLEHPPNSPPSSTSSSLSSAKQSLSPSPPNAMVGAAPTASTATPTGKSASPPNGDASLRAASVSSTVPMHSPARQRDMASQLWLEQRARWQWRQRRVHAEASANAGGSGVGATLPTEGGALAVTINAARALGDASADEELTIAEADVLVES